MELQPIIPTGETWSNPVQIETETRLLTTFTLFQYEENWKAPNKNRSQMIKKSDDMMYIKIPEDSTRKPLELWRLTSKWQDSKLT